MLAKVDIVNFLKRDPDVARLNFFFAGLKVWPDAYRVQVADAIDKGEIKIKFDSPAVSKGAGASYYPGFDTLDFAPGLSLSTFHEKAFVVHECTHAVTDLQDLGDISNFENEALGYIAEALYLESAGSLPISAHAIRSESHRIAKNLIASGGHYVMTADRKALLKEIMAAPQYSSKPIYDSNRFKRSVFHDLIR